MEYIIIISLSIGILGSSFMWSIMKMIQDTKLDDKFLIFILRWAKQSEAKGKVKKLATNRKLGRTTDIRNAIKSGHNPVPYIAESTWDIIKDYKLYGLQ